MSEEAFGGWEVQARTMALLLEIVMQHLTIVSSLPRPPPRVRHSRH